MSHLISYDTTQDRVVLGATAHLTLPAQVSYMVCAYVANSAILDDGVASWVHSIQDSVEFMKHWLVEKSSYPPSTMSYYRMHRAYVDNNTKGLVAAKLDLTMYARACIMPLSAKMFLGLLDENVEAGLLRSAVKILALMSKLSEPRDARFMRLLTTVANPFRCKTCVDYDEMVEYCDTLSKVDVYFRVVCRRFMQVVHNEVKTAEKMHYVDGKLAPIVIMYDNVDIVESSSDHHTTSTYIMASRYRASKILAYLIPLIESNAQNVWLATMVMLRNPSCDIKDIIAISSVHVVPLYYLADYDPIRCGQLLRLLQSRYTTDVIAKFIPEMTTQTWMLDALGEQVKMLPFYNGPLGVAGLYLRCMQLKIRAEVITIQDEHAMYGDYMLCMRKEDIIRAKPAQIIPCEQRITLSRHECPVVICSPPPAAAGILQLLGDVVDMSPVTCLHLWCTETELNIILSRP